MKHTFILFVLSFAITASAFAEDKAKRVSFSNVPCKCIEFMKMPDGREDSRFVKAYSEQNKVDDTLRPGGICRILDTETGHVLHQFNEYQEQQLHELYPIHFSPDRTKLVFPIYEHDKEGNETRLMMRMVNTKTNKVICGVDIPAELRFYPFSHAWNSMIYCRTALLIGFSGDSKKWVMHVGIAGKAEDDGRMQVRVFDTATGKLTEQFFGYLGNVFDDTPSKKDAAQEAKSQVLAAYNTETNTTRLLDAETLQERFKVEGQACVYTASGNKRVVVCTPCLITERYMAEAEEKKRTDIILDGQTFKELYRIEQPHPGTDNDAVAWFFAEAARSYIFSPDCTRLAAVNAKQKSVCILDGKTFKEISRFRYTGRQIVSGSAAFPGIEFDNTGKRLRIRTCSGKTGIDPIYRESVFLFNTDTGKELVHVNSSEENIVTGSFHESTGKYFVVEKGRESRNRQTMVFDMETGKEVAGLPDAAPDKTPPSVKENVSRNKRRKIVYEKEQLKLVDAETGKELLKLKNVFKLSESLDRAILKTGEDSLQVIRLE